jgi:hypothetical protein
MRRLFARVVEVSGHNVLRLAEEIDFSDRSAGLGR